MAATPPRQIGTLIVVILKARNLPNKRHIGKQDPYCSVVLNGEKRRTKAIRRGGQHPEWDEEIRFTLFEGADDQPGHSTNGGGTPPPPPPKANGKGPPTIKGGKFMAISCYAEDPREPDLIGETNVDLTEVLTKGETDEWFTLQNKDKYCGEVYLELTFWSNEPAPAKKAQKPKSQRQYGGPGSFVPAGESTSSLNNGDVQQAITRLPSTSSLDVRRDHIPPSLRSSSSVAQLDLYVPPYETSRSHSSVDSMANDFGEMVVGNRRSRRQSLPPQQSAYIRQPSSSVSFPDPTGLSAPGYQQRTYSDSSSTYEYDRSVTPAASLYHQNSLPHEQYEPYQPQYESSVAPPSGYPPTARQGFAPLPTSTPAPIGYGPSPSHMPPQSQIPSSNFSSLPQPPLGSVPPANYSAVPPSGSYHQSFTQQQPGYPYQSYATSSSSIPPQQQQQLPPPPPPASVPPLSQMIAQQPYPTSTTTIHTSTSSYTPPTGNQRSITYSPTGQQSGPYSPTSAPYSSSNPPPTSYPQSNTPPTSYPSSNQPPLPGPPPPLPQSQSSQYHQPITRRPSLPPPPMNSFPNQQQPGGYPNQQPVYQALPPPPPPPSMPPHAQHESSYSYPPASQSQTFYPGPPPRPPTQPPVQPQYMPPQGGYPPAVAGGTGSNRKRLSDDPHNAIYSCAKSYIHHPFPMERTD
ncbi:hypothetical protein B0H21DRAFT_684854 [Amylocystis lapponica]|nr:hypothetical protein B0H21DRAFT_684854 [Amylocystis lapponica]